MLQSCLDSGLINPNHKALNARAHSTVRVRSRAGKFHAGVFSTKGQSEKKMIRFRLGHPYMERLRLVGR